MAWVRRLPSGKWQANYRDSTRARSSERMMPRIYAQDQEGDLRRGSWTDPALARVHFEEWADTVMRTTLNQRMRRAKAG
jgi:hypothetical protein